jgi:TIR domain
MTGIFISYRRDDTQGWVGRLAHALQESFPSAQVFYDIASIAPGEDFTAAIEEALYSSQTVLVLIGPRWLSAQTEEGRRRIDDPLVRIEIAAALARPIPVVPLLFGETAMPPANLLPEALKPLALRQGHEISNKRWDYDCDELFQTLGKALGVPPLRNSPKKGASSGDGISVSEGMTITNSTVGDIVGAKISGRDAMGHGRIDVARNARIQGANVGDIVGLKAQKTPKRKKDSQ